MPEETTDAPEEQKPQTAETPEAAPPVCETAGESALEAPAEAPPATDEPAAEAAETVEDAADDGLPPNDIKVEDVGSLRKKVTVTVPRARIDAKFNELFGELSHSAQVPGFRIGRAPRRLIEKRFGREVGQDVRNGLIGEALGKALDGAEFRVLGEPDLDLEAIELPEQDDMTFSFEIEVAPEFDLPDYEGVEIEKPAVEITDEHVEETLTSYRGQFGVLKPIDGPAAEGDVVYAEAKISGEGIEGAEESLELRVGPGQVLGVPLEDLGKTLEGKAAGETAELTTTVPAGHPNEAWRDKEVTVTLKVQDVKRTDLPALDDELARRVGYDSAEEMRQAVRRGLRRRAESAVHRSMQDQVIRYLLANTELEVPEGVAARSAAQLVRRRAVDLMMRGVPREQIANNIQRLQEQADTEASEELKLSFILGQIAEKEQITVEDGEVNARIADIAAQQNRRPERLKSEMADNGQLDQLASAIVEDKTVDFILEKARIVEPKPEPEDQTGEATADAPAEAGEEAAEATGQAEPEAEVP